MTSHDDFSARAAAICDAAPPDTRFIVMTDHPSGIASVALTDTASDPTAAIDQLLAGTHHVAGAATLLNWAPDAGPTRPAWLLITVHRHTAARFHVRRLAEDTRWWRLGPVDAPWLALATAASLRGALNNQPMSVRTATDRRLFRRPAEEPDPPTSSDGRL